MKILEWLQLTQTIEVAKGCRNEEQKLKHVEMKLHENEGYSACR